MNDDGFFEELRAQLAARHHRPIEAMVLVHKGPDRPIGRCGRLHPNNALILTDQDVKIIALGGRSGVKPRKEVASWARGNVQIDVHDTEAGSWMASIGSTYTYDVHRLRIVGPDLILVVDVMRENAFSDPAREIRTLLAALGQEVAR